jgi:hypothetical protein
MSKLQAQGFNPGGLHQERRALKGRQIEPPNKAEAGSDVRLSHAPIAARCLSRGNSSELYLVPASLAPSGRAVYLEIPRVETLG